MYLNMSVWEKHSPFKHNLLMNFLFAEKFEGSKKFQNLSILFLNPDDITAKTETYFLRGWVKKCAKFDVYSKSKVIHYVKASLVTRTEILVFADVYAVMF